MHSHTIYIYEIYEYPNQHCLIDYTLFASKKDACDYYIKDNYFHDLDIFFDQDSKRCWYCDYEKLLALSNYSGDDWYVDNDSGYDEEIGYYKDSVRDKICKKCDKQMITLSEYKKIQYPILLQRYEENGVDDTRIYIEEYEIEFKE
jgi:hypothetical protein